MWEPDPEWHPLPGGMSPATLGVWRTAIGDRPVVIKRLVRPTPSDPEAYSDPQHFAYWRREADIALAGVVLDTEGVRGPRAVAEEDPDGITITADYVEDAASNGLFIAHGLGRFTHNDLRHVRHLARHELRDRVQRVEGRGGWPTLARTRAGEITEPLWARRADLIAESEAAPQVPLHGDPTPGNMRGREGDDVIAVDWSTVGYGPIGFDLGLYALGAREAFGPLLEAYTLGAAASHEAGTIRFGAAVAAAFTAITRAEWTLSRAGAGADPVEGTFRHPAVAPQLRALQRVADQIDWLLLR